MIRGTTPTLTFTLPCQESDLAEYWITISQKYENIKIDKTSADCTAEDNVISVTLTQEEMLRLIGNKPVYVQMRALTTEDKALATKMWTCTVDDILREGVITRGAN